MPDSPDQIIHKLQQENKKLKTVLEQRDKKLVRKDTDLKIERSLWKSMEDGWRGDVDSAAALHRVEVFDDIIGDEAKLHSATLMGREKFQHVLEQARAFLEKSGELPLFRDEALVHLGDLRMSLFNK